MRQIRFRNPQGRIFEGIPQSPDMAEVIHFDPQGRVQYTGKSQQISAWLAPVEPVNIFCIGKNYADHAAEFDSEVPEHPVIFMKPTSAVIGHGQPIVIPKACAHGPEVDYECELAVVIGPEPVRDVAEEDALDAVLGYTLANDVSARKWQKHGGGGQWIRGKSFDTFCPLGPVLVTRDEIPDPQNLTIRTKLNGQVMQEDNTSHMVHSVAKIISFISRDTTLLPGTVILTGTPSGVGAARKPPVFLKAGDSVTVEIDGLGELTNPVIAAV